MNEYSDKTEELGVVLATETGSSIPSLVQCHTLHVIPYLPFAKIHAHFDPALICSSIVLYILISIQKCMRSRPSVVQIVQIEQTIVKQMGREAPMNTIAGSFLSNT